MIIYLYFNLYYFNSQQFMNKLKLCNFKYGTSQDLEIHTEEQYYHFCRIKLNEHSLLDDLVKEFDNEIYKIIIYK